MAMEDIQQQIESALRSDWIAALVSAVFIVAVTAFAAHVVTKFLRHVLESGETKLPSSSIFINIGRSSVWILGVCIMLDSCFKVNVSALIAALGVGGIAISLGFQDTISNLIGGLQVSLMRIVEPGDNITVGTSTGIVKDVTWRHTTITSSTGEEIIVPNSIINKTALVHLPAVDRVVMPFVVTTTGVDLDERGRAIEALAAKTIEPIGRCICPPRVVFVRMTDTGFSGKLKFTLEDASKVDAAVDAVIRSVAPLTRSISASEDRALIDQASRFSRGEEADAQGNRDADRASRSGEVDNAAPCESDEGAVNRAGSRFTAQRHRGWGGRWKKESGRKDA